MRTAWNNLIESQRKRWSNPNSRILHGLSQRGNKNALGHKHSEEIKQKIRESNLGRKASDETKKKMSVARKGMVHSEEAKKKISNSHLGLKPSKESIEKNRQAHLGRKHSLETREMMSKIVNKRYENPENRKKIGDSQRGNKGSNWQGGITPIHTLIRHCFKYKEWVKSIFVKDNYTCTECGVKSRKGEKVVLNADHIISFSDIMKRLRIEQGVDNLFEKAMEYAPLWDMSNGRTLCLPCHKMTDNYLCKSSNQSRMLINTH